MHRTVQIHHDPLDARQFEIAVRRLANSLPYGSDESVFLGSGMDYAQSRRYEPGDPIKAMDWRLTARTGRHYVKEYQATRQMPVFFLIDTSASMCVSSIRMSKYAWAVQLAAGLAVAAQEHMRPVGLLTCGERELHIRPTLSRDVVLQWAHQLRSHNFTEQTELGRKVRQLAPSLTPRCLVFVLSDLHDPEAVPALRILAQEHEVVVLQLQDPAERGIEGGGIFLAREAETGRTFVTTGRQDWRLPEAEVKSLAGAGVDRLLLKTDEPILPKLRQFLKHRGARRR